MPDDFPVTVRDSCGNPVVIDPIGGEVTLSADPYALPLRFGAQEREEFSRIWVAASHVADQQEVSGDG